MGVSGSRLKATQLRQENVRLESKIERLIDETTKLKADITEMTKWRNALAEQVTGQCWTQEESESSDRSHGLHKHSFLKSSGTSTVLSNTQVVLKQELRRLREDNHGLQAELRHLKCGLGERSGTSTSD